jgi:hypothetical protein
MPLDAFRTFRYKTDRPFSLQAFRGIFVRSRSQEDQCASNRKGVERAGHATRP